MVSLIVNLVQFLDRRRRTAEISRSLSAWWHGLFAMRDSAHACRQRAKKRPDDELALIAGTKLAYLQRGINSLCDDVRKTAMRFGNDPASAIPEDTDAELQNRSNSANQ